MTDRPSFPPDDPNGLRGRRVTVMGLGARGGGVGVARYAANAGAIVTVSDMAPAEKLAGPIAELAGLPIRYAVGGHDEADFANADVVVRNPGVRRDNPLLALARDRGARIEMEMSLFLRACPAPVIGVTGTKGKTTVATLCGELLRAWDPTSVTAGNMGISALDQLDRIGPETPVVLEISSWQLEACIEHGLSPHIGVITEIAEDHLNTYRDFDEYAETKRGMVLHQRAGDFAVLNAANPEIRRAAGMTPGDVVWFGAADPGSDGAWLSGDALVWRRAGEEWSVPRPATPALRGIHNAANALAALAAARLRGATQEAIAAGLAGYRGVRDRMEPVATVGGVQYINDTTATAPVAAAAAISSIDGGTVHLLAGGADKGLDPAPLADAAAARGAALRVYLFDGTGTPAIGAALRTRGVQPAGPFRSMEEIVAAARERARPGDTILLSPGCASFGLFRDEFDRGEQFRALAQRLAAEEAGQ